MSDGAWGSRGGGRGGGRGGRGERGRGERGGAWGGDRGSNDGGGERGGAWGGDRGSSDGGGERGGAWGGDRGSNDGGGERGGWGRGRGGGGSWDGGGGRGGGGSGGGGGASEGGRGFGGRDDDGAAGWARGRGSEGRGSWGDDDRGGNGFRGRGGGGGRGGYRGGFEDVQPRGRAGARGRSASYPSVARDDNLEDERPGPAPAFSEPQFQEYREEVKVEEAPATEDGGGDESEDSKRSRNGSYGGGDGRRERRESYGDRGRGGEGGRRGARRERFNPIDRMDVVVSKPPAYTGDTGKRGQSGQPMSLMGNFFTLQKKTDWCIYNYRVDFKPDEERTQVKKALLKPHAASVGAYIFDGSSLYVAQRLHPDPMLLYSMRESDQEKVELTIRLVQELVPGDVMYLQFFNITVRKCLSAMKLEELGRHFYDREQGIKMAALRLELWPGYITSLRNYENNVLLCVEVTHKVLRQENVLNVISQMRGNRNPEKAITDELVGTIVMTHYNRKTYRIDDIDWDSTPANTFDMKGEKISYADYYHQRYRQTVSEMHQPMLVSRPKKRDFHRGMTGPILLVPEFCQMTGLSDAMRSNFNMMKELNQHLHMGPRSRMDAVSNFMKRLKSTPEVQEDLQRWGLEFSKDLVSFKGRVLPGEPILFGENTTETPNKKADWTMAFRSKPLLQTKDLHSWVIIVPNRDASGVDNLVRVMQTVSRPLQFNISHPKEIMTLPNIQIQNYVKQIDQAVANYEKRGNLQLIFVILPTNKLDTYAAVKRRCVVDYGITSQCYLAKNVQTKQLMAIATKCVVQMSAKLGGEPWQVQNPLKSSQAMIVGFDVYHCGKRKGASVGAMVATTSPTLAKYYSTVSFHNHRDELSSNVCQDIAKCVHAYEEINRALPDRIIMYRDGVGEGQLSYVYGTELEQIKIALKAVYSARNHPLPKFTFIIVTKKMNTRIFTSPNSSHGADNPEPGTIVDDVITLPERFDFYLISQCVKQGTVSPTAYNVLFDQQGLKPDQIQRFTYKMCHMYFNWSGTVGVPAPCQYAHKLAYLTGLALGNTPSEKLSHLLYYL